MTFFLLFRARSGIHVDDVVATLQAIQFQSVEHNHQVQNAARKKVSDEDNNKESRKF